MLIGGLQISRPECSPTQTQNPQLQEKQPVQVHDNDNNKLNWELKEAVQMSDKLRLFNSKFHHESDGVDIFCQKLTLFFNLGGGLFSEIFCFDPPFGHKWQIDF